MPTQPPRFRPGLARPTERKAWAQPGRNAHRRKRGRAAVEDRRRYLAEHPLCIKCLEAGVTRAADQVDHVRDDLRDELWHADANKQALCLPHHKAKTAAEAQRGRRGAADPT